MTEHPTEPAAAQPSPTGTAPSAAPSTAPSTARRTLVLAVKLGLTGLVLVLLGRKILGQENAESLRAQLASLDPRWLAPALFAQVAMVLLGTIRWKTLLEGQGVHASFRHLFGSMMIGRYFGAVTPAGLGFQGYRIYDIATRTGKPARAAATVGVEVLAGQLGFFSVLLVASAFGSAYMPRSTLLAVDLVLLGLIAGGITLLAKPVVVARLSRAVLGGVPTRIQSLVDAVCAYEGQGLRLVRAVLLSTGIHVGHNLIYFCTARALGVDQLSVGMIFFATSMQILSTFAPITINGVGVREATAVAFYTSVGVPAVVAALVATLGFLVEMTVSVMGGPVFLLRRHNYVAELRVDDPERERRVAAQIEEQAVELPSVLHGLSAGAAGGLYAGVVVGLVEGAVVVFGSGAARDLRVLGYGVAAYALVCGAIGFGSGLVLAWLGRAIRRGKTEEAVSFGRHAGGIAAAFGFVLGVFRVRRDVFDEQLVWKSKAGLTVLLGAGGSALLVYLVLSTALAFVARRRVGRVLAHPLAAAGLAATLATAGLLSGAPAVAHTARRTLGAAPAQSGNVLVIVVDTLRADHLPAYGYRDGHTPALERFAADAIRFDQHFANASWTRPSFASILTGRYVASHRVMGKADALPLGLSTLAEAFAGSGYQTAGIVTNYNVTPYFQFDQGFDRYDYLEPAFVLGANDAQAKLLLVQMARRVVERFSPARPGSAYRDAADVNRAVVRALDGFDDAHPFFLFAAYMDPHDPYYVHPYDGTPGYARATHQNPGPEEADRLRALYDGEIAYWDEQFGLLVETLKQRGLYDELTIVITSDHGEEFMEHGGYWHGTTLYDEQVRVPLFVKLPFSTRGGAVVDLWSQSIDLMPSLLAQNGVPASAGTQGRDDLLRADFAGSTDVLAEEDHEGNQLVSLRARRGGSEVKYITANEGNPRGLATAELYRVDMDPGERVDLATDVPAVTTLLRERLAADQARARSGRIENVEQVALGAHREALGALGYAQTEAERPAGADAGAPAP